MAREAPPNVCVPPSPILDDSAFEDTLEQQCNIQNLNIENYNNYRYDQDVSNSKVKV